MKISIYDKIRKRYLSNDELSGYYFYNGMEHHESGGEWEDTESFRVNLLTCKLQVLKPEFLKKDLEWDASHRWRDSEDFEVSIKILCKKEIRKCLDYAYKQGEKRNKEYDEKSGEESWSSIVTKFPDSQ